MLRRILALATAASTMWTSSAYAITPPTVVQPGGIAQPVLTAQPVGPASPPSVVNINGSTPDWKATLRQALATPNTTVYLASTVDMDLSGEDSIPIAQGVALIGGQPCPLASQSSGGGGAAPPTLARATSPALATPICGGRTAAFPGPRLYTTTSPDALFVVNCIPGDLGGDGVRLSGFRLQGPDWDENFNGPKPRGIRVDSCTGVEIANMELSGWAGAAVRVINTAGRQSGPEAVKVHDSFIHHNQHVGGEGYGVDVSSGGWALIEHNVFDFNRHAVTHGNIDTPSGFAHKGGYMANENLVLKGGGYNDIQGNGTAIGWVQQFDVHGDSNCPGNFNSLWLWNCGQSGKEYQVLHNAFQFTRARAFDLRGTPLVGAFVDNNVFAHNSVSDAVGTEPWGIGGLSVGTNTVHLDTFGKYGVCDFDGDGQDDLFLATGNTWWYMSSAKQHWVYLNSMPETLDQLALGDFSGTGRCDVFAVHGNGWDVSPGGRGPWQSLGNFGVPFDQLRFGHFTGGTRTEIFRRAPDGSWWLISPGVFGWTQLAGSSLPLSQLHFGDFNGHGITDVVANVNGHWSVSWGGRSAWLPLNTNLSDSLDNTLIADLDGKGTDDILRYTNVNAQLNGQWQVSMGGRTTWQPLAQLYLPEVVGGMFVGHFDGSKGAQILAISGPEGSTLCDLVGCRRSTIYSRASGTFTPYGQYSY